MGSILSCNCKICLIDKEKEINDNQSQKVIPISQKYSRGNSLTSSTTSINKINKSFNTEKNDISMSSEDSIKRSSKENIIHLLNNLISEQFYEKLINGERLHNLLEFLYTYNNNILFCLLEIFLIKIKNIFNEVVNIENLMKKIHQNYMKMYLYLLADNILDEIRENIEEDSRIKYNLIDVIESCTEIYHFFCFEIFKQKRIYKKFYWDKYKNFYNYIEQKITEVKDGIININLSIGDNKLKIIE